MTEERKFDKWFAENYRYLFGKLVCTNLFGEICYDWQRDIFHDAYLVCRNQILGTNEDLYEVQFIAAFKSNYKRTWNAMTKEIDVKDFFWSILKFEEIEDVDITGKDFSGLVSRIWKYAKKTFSNDEYSLLQMYFRHGLTTYEIADVYGTAQGPVWQRLFKMKNMICAKFEDEFKAL